MGAAAIPAMISAGGAIAGGLLANKGSQQSGTTTTTSVPWGGVQPYLYRGYQAGDRLLSESFNNMGPYQAALAARSAGSPVTDAAKNLATSTINGDYLNSNPFLNGAVQDAMNMAKTQVNSQFGPFNNYGSSGHEEALSRSLMNASLPYLSQNYENERGRQYAAMSQAPALANQDYTDISALQQANLAPWDFLGRYAQSIGGLPTSGGSVSQPYFSNPYSGAVGGALLANQLYSQYQQPSLQSAMVPGQYSLTNPAYG